MRLKSEFRKRLEFLYRCLGKTLASDIQGDLVLGNLFPALFSLYSFIWSSDNKKFFKK